MTGGSRVCYATGTAVIRAAQDVREQLRARAAKIWAIGVECVGWEDGCAVPLGGAARHRERREEAALGE